MENQKEWSTNPIDITDQPFPIATWNVQGLKTKRDKLNTIDETISKKGILICGLCETHYQETSYLQTNNYVVYCSSAKTSRNNTGVAVMVSKSIIHWVSKCTQKSDRVICIKFQTEPTPINIIQIYAPTSSVGKDEDVEKLYHEIEDLMKSIPTTEITFVMGDFNAKIGEQKLDRRDTRVREHNHVGSFGVGTRNKRGQRLLNFVIKNDLTVLNSRFDHPKSELYTWRSPPKTANSRSAENQIDFILTHKAYAESFVHNVFTVREAEPKPDHRLLIMHFKCPKSMPIIPPIVSTPVESRQQNFPTGRKHIDLQAHSDADESESSQASGDTDESVDSFRTAESFTDESEQENSAGRIQQKMPSTKTRVKMWAEFLETFQFIEDRKLPTKLDIADEERQPDIQIDEICHAMSNLKIDEQVKDNDDLWKMIEAADPSDIEYMKKIYDALWKTRQWRDKWHEIFISKHAEGFKIKSQVYDKIQLQLQISTTLLNIIKNRLIALMTKEQGDRFARESINPERFATEQILNIRQLVEKSREFKVPMFLGFIKFINPFDHSIPSKVWESLTDTGIPKHLICIIQQVYEKCSVKVETSSKGIREECLLSPILFNFCREYIIKSTLLGCNECILISGQKISNFQCKETATLITTSKVELQKLLSKSQEISRRFGLEIDKKGTKIMIISEKTSSDRKNICEYEVLDQWIYLGSAIDKNGTSDGEIDHRATLANIIMAELLKTTQYKFAPENQKIELVRTKVFSTFLYAAETWTIKKDPKEKIISFEMSIYRQIARSLGAEYTDRRILEELNIREEDRLLTVIFRKKCEHFDRVIRANGLEKIIILGELAAGKSSGRPNIRWRDDILKSAGMKLNDFVKEVERERVDWDRLKVTY